MCNRNHKMNCQLLRRLTNSTRVSKSIRFLSSDDCYGTKYAKILVSKKGVHRNVGFIQLNKPTALNSLCSGLIGELAVAVEAFNKDDSIKCLVVTGNDRVFAAGADVKEMAGRSYADTLKGDFLVDWQSLAASKKPVIAAVNGVALGGGCEIAMMCDIIYAGDKARFGQPEIKLGTLPGAGGTQRLVRAVGKSRAMEIILSGDMFTAQEAAAAGLVSRVYPADELVDKAIGLAERISVFSGIALQSAKEAINAADNMSLSDGLRFEKNLFYASFATNDCKEGMQAFVEKRPAKFTNS